MIKDSELILNPDGSIYHLCLKPSDIAHNIITVGDPERVNLIASYFEKIEVDKTNREFKTITGYYKGKRLTVISTGIGTDNIDIVLNELDALVNIDFESRMIKEQLVSLNIIRIGTSGTIRSDVDLDSYIISAYGVGIGGLLSSYLDQAHDQLELNKWIEQHSTLKNIYSVKADESLLSKFSRLGRKGITITANGFYGPQSRSIRIKSSRDYVKAFKSHKYNALNVTNIEMETAGIYALSKLLGHKAISLNAILANRENGAFSNQAPKTIQELIESSLEIIKELD